MSDILKQRLVGALILLALGVAFWPFIFDQPEHRRVTDQPLAPSPPAVSTEPVAATGLQASQPATAMGAASEATHSPVQEPPSVDVGETTATAFPADPSIPAPVLSAAPPAREEPPQNVKVDSGSVPITWTLQVATVSAAQKAEELRGKLLAMNQKAYITTVTGGGKTLYRVCIGPSSERVELEKLQTGINARFGVSTMVVRYVP